MAITQQGYVPRTTINGGVFAPSQWLGGGAATALTKIGGQGITSIAHGGANGKYLITFSETGYLFTLPFFSVLDTAAGGKWTVRVDDWDANAKTLLIYCVSTTTETDLPTTASLCILAVHCDSTVPQ
jgi:hypothetical protein